MVVADCNFESFEHERAVCLRNGFDLQVFQCRSETELVTTCPDADVLLVQYCPISERALRALRSCRAIVRYGAGTDNIDLHAAERLRMPVCHVPDYGLDAVADHAAALALALARQIPFWDASIRRGEWPSGTNRPLHRLDVLTFGVLGAGLIGKATLQRMRGFGVRLVAHDPSLTAEELADLGVEKLGLDELFERADILSLHLPLNEDTQFIVNDRRLRKMKSSALLINTARGGLVDSEALAAALASGVIAGAGIDVHESEPLAQDHPLRDCPNAILTPHIGYYSVESVSRLQQLAAEEAERALLGKPLRCRIA
jgi:D-3-phosphoglycerate dehydrogenase